MVIPENISKIEEYKKSGDVHASNILTKYKSKKLTKKQKEIIIIHIDNYIKYRNEFEKDNSLSSRTTLFNKFKKKSYNLNRDPNSNKEIFPFQSKLLSTIMEEFFKLILAPIATANNLLCGSIKAYNQLSIENSISGEQKFIISEKDQDLAIYKNIFLKINDINHKISVPLLSIECKTWLDKTMLEGSASTAYRIKQGVTNAKFYIITETYGVGKNVIKPKEIDKIFITKKRFKDDVSHLHDNDLSVIQLIYNEVYQHIENLNKKQEELIEHSIKLGVIH
jgi:hypothetical protein